MIDINADQSAVSFERENDVIKSREFYQRGIRRPAGCDAEGRPLLPEEPAAEEYQAQPTEQESAALVAASPAPPPRPMDADAALRRARMGVCLCLVLVLLLAWMMQRRSQRTS